MRKVLLMIGLSLISLGIKAQTYQVSTAAGNGTVGNVNGPAASSELNQPYGVKTDNDSVIYIADVQNHSIRKLNYNTNVVSLVAGTGTAGHQDGVGTSAKFNAPVGVFYSNGFLYVVEASNYIRKIDLNNNNTVSTVAGTGTGGFQNGAAATAKFNNPASLWVDPNGDIYVVDYFNHCIRLISGGVVSTYAGTPTSSGLVNGTLLASKFNLPRDITKDSKGDFYIGELGNNVIRKINNGNVSTFAGNGTQASVDGNATTASFSHPGGICVTAQGYFYITDGTGNKIRKMDTLGNVITIAGTGVGAFTNGAGSIAQFNRPEALTYDIHGNLYVGDPDNERVRKISVPEVDCAPAENITGVANLCSGDGTVLTANGAATSYTWSANAGSVNTSTVSVFPTSTTTYTLLSSGTSGCVGTSTFAVTVVTTPTLSITGSTNLCSGNSTTLTAYGASSYTWDTGSFSVSSPTISLTPNSSVTFTLTGANGNCIDTKTVAINVTQTPTLSITGQTNICSDAGTVLTGNGASTYNWSANAGGVTTSTVALNPTSTTIYTLTGANGSCIVLKTVTVNVTSTPTVGISGSTMICSDASTILNGSGATTYTWSNNAGGTSTNSVSISPSSTDTYTLSGTEANGFCSSSAVITVTVLPSPTVTVNSQTICIGATATLTATGANSYTWNPAPAFSNGSGSTVIDAPSQTTTYTITGIGGNNCLGITTATLTVDPCSTTVNTLSNNEFVVYPNPCSGILIIETGTVLPNADVEITNGIGETVMKNALRGFVNSIDISHLNDGIYFISIRTQNALFIKKVILQK